MQLKGIEVGTLGIVEAPVAEVVFSIYTSFSRVISRMNEDMHRGIWEKLLSTALRKNSGHCGYG